MKKALYYLIAAIIIFTSCKKGEMPNINPDGKTFSNIPENGPGNTFSSPGGNINPTTNPGIDDDDDDDDDGQPTGPNTDIKKISLDGTEYKNITVACASSGGFYAISAVNGTPSFRYTIYFSDKPSSSGIYSVEDIVGATPSGPSKAWAVLSMDGKNYIATTGSITVTIKNGKPSVSFTNILMEEDTDDVTASGEFSC
jgi:hypothetical protein